jgi:hypothetical protein
VIGTHHKAENVMKFLNLFDRSPLREKATQYRARPGFAVVRLAKIYADAGDPLRLTYEPIVAWRPLLREDGGIEAQTEDGRWCYPHIVRCPDGKLIEFDPEVEISTDMEFRSIDKAEALRHLLND